MTEDPRDPRIGALPDSHGHAKGEHKAFADERPIPYTARMLFLWFYHACRRGSPRFMMVADHINYLTFEDPAAVHVVRRALKLAQAGDLYGAAETAGVELGHASVVSEGLRKGMRYSIGAEVDNDPRSRPDAQNIVDAMKPDGVIRSVHFLPITHPQHGENWMWAFDNPEFVEYFELVGTERVWEIYMETLLDAIDKLPGHIVGHFYVPAKFGHWPDDATLESYEDRLIDACAERGMAVEVNSRYLYKYYVGDDAQLEKFRTAHLRLMRKAKAKGVMVAVGSDAHSPRDQGGAFEAVLALLDEADINEIAFPLNDRLARVALRATEEILRQHSAALAERSAPARPRVGLTPDPPEDDDALDDDSERTVEPRIESANPDAEIILPPAPEPEPEPEEPAVAAAPKVKAPPKPRKSRAKAPAVAAAVASDAPATEATPAAEVVAASEPQPELAAVVAPVPEATPVPAKTVAPKRATAKPKSAPVPKTEPEPALVVATPKAAAKPAPAPKAAAKPPAAKAPIAKAAVPKAAASKAAPVKKVEPIAKKAPPAKAAPKKAAPPVKKVAPVKKAASKKVAPAKKAAAKAPPAKAAAKKAVKKKAAPAKKSPAKKTVAKKSAKPAAKKTARTSATSAKRPAAKRPSPKKPAAKKAAKKKTARR